MTKREKELLTPRDAADLIGKSEYWLRMRRRVPKSGPPYYRIGGRIAYARADVLEWLEGQFRQ